MRLLVDEGLDGLSLRTLATRLGVQAPTLYWHIGSKSELLDGLADAIMDEVIEAAPKRRPDQGWAEWMLAALVEFRRALLRHRDGARIISGARMALRRADFTELAMSTLVESGVEAQQARLLVLAGERFTIGYVLEEQAPRGESEQPPDLEELQRRFPVTTGAIVEYFSDGRTSDDLFRDIARLVLGMPPGN
jgi:TetR/AcrR family tetracycline transcriptional repressor